ASRTTLRLVVGRALHSATLLLPVPLIYAAVSLTWIKVVQPPTEVQHWFIIGFVGACLVPLGGLGFGLLRSRPRLWGAQTLDRHHELKGRVANALAFGSEPQRTPLMDAAIDDAVANCGTLSPRRA